MKQEVMYTTFELCAMLNEAREKEMEQSLINRLAFELVCRLYVPFTGMSFDDMLLEYGYVKPETRSK